MGEPRQRPTDETTEAETVRRRVRQKTTPTAGAFATFEALGGSDAEGFSYIEALQKSSPHLVGFAQADDRGCDNDWLTSR